GHPVPGVAQAAIQEGRYVGRLRRPHHDGEARRRHVGPQVRGRDDFVDEPDAPSLLRADHRAGQNELKRGPISNWLPPGQPYPWMPRPPTFSSLKAGSTSNGKASSIQYLLIMGATLVSMKARTRLRIASSSALKVRGAIPA